MVTAPETPARERVDLRWLAIALGLMAMAWAIASTPGSGRSHHVLARRPRTSAAPLALLRTPCVYTGHSLAKLAAFDALVGRNIECEMVYSYGATEWSDWADPWFIGQNYPDKSLNLWATAPGTHRTLIISQSLFPNSLNGRDWLQPGASGAYMGYARTLARNLVAAGLGDAVVRLAHEANGNWFPDSIPDTPAGDALWIRFWRNTVIAMRSVPGAHFLFDWCVNAGYRPVPLASFYPGDDVVDIIGLDVYDTAVNGTGPVRWQQIYHEADGPGDVAAFAAAHHKPLSIPEWGIGPASDTQARFGGDDPAFIDGIASLVQSHEVAYQSYFYQAEEGTALNNSPKSVIAYIAHFGAHGDAVAPEGKWGSNLTPVSSPSIAGFPAGLSHSAPFAPP